METAEKKSLVAQFVACYNQFDIDGMMLLVHPEIEFTNVRGGDITTRASGAAEFRQLAELSRRLFVSREQRLGALREEEEAIVGEVRFTGVLMADIPGMARAGETLSLEGTARYRFAEGKIIALTDAS